MRNIIAMTLLTLLVGGQAFAEVTPVPNHPGAGYGSSMLLDISNFHFDTNNEGWLHTYVGMPPGATYETLYENTSAPWSPTGGDPDGHVLQTVGSDRDQRAYWLGFIGDNGFMGDLEGRLIQTNVYSTGNWITISGANGAVGGDDGNVYARWVISREVGGSYGMYISKRAVSLDMNSFTGWSNLVVGVTAGNFMRWPNGDDPSITWSEVMTEYNSIGLYIFSGTDDMSDVGGGGTTWFNDGGISRVQHYGAGAISGTATWGVDNPTAGFGVISEEEVSFGQLKKLYH